MRIRAMEVGDLDRVLAIAAGLPTAPEWPRAVYAEAILTPGRRVALVAEDAGLVVGFVVAGVVAPEAELESIAVDSDWQGRGVGSGLLEGLMAELRRAGVGDLMLEVRASNVAAMGLYARMEFRGVGRRRGYYSGPVEDAVLLQRRV